MRFTERLQLLNGGRKHFLEFLRNLTPQVILLSIAMLLGARLDFSRFDINNIGMTFLFFAMLFSFLLAFYANSTLLYENCFGDLKKWVDDLGESLTKREVKGWRRFYMKLTALFRERLVEVLEMLAVLFFLQVAFAVVVSMSIHSASDIWYSNYRHEQH